MYPILSYVIFAQTPSLIHQNKPNIIAYYHIEAFYDPSNYSRLKAKITFDICHDTPCSMGYMPQGCNEKQYCHCAP